MADPYAAFSSPVNADNAQDQQADPYAAFSSPAQEPSQQSQEHSSPAAAAGFGRGGRAPSPETLAAMRDNGLSRTVQGAIDDPIGTFKAIPAGFNRGVAQLAGVPADTAQNIVDLGGMGYGMARSLIKQGNIDASDQFYEPADRAQLPLTGEWNARQLDDASKKLTGETVTQNMAPDNPAARLVYSASSAVPGAITGRAAISNAAGGAAQGIVAEAGGDPAMQAAAGMMGGRAVPTGSRVQPGAVERPQPEANTQAQPSRHPAMSPEIKEIPAQQTAQVRQRLEAAKILHNEGIPLDKAQRTGSKAAAMLKQRLDDSPVTAGSQKAFAEKQMSSFTKAVLKRIGEDSDVATPEVMGRAADRIGSVFDEVAERNPVRYDRKLNDDLAQLAKESFRELPSQEASVISRQVEQVFEKAREGGGAIDGKAYQNLRSSLGRVSQQRTPLGHWAGELRDVIDDALQRSASPNDLKNLKTARQQYRRMLQIEGSIDTEGLGQISPSKLANSLATKSNRRASIYGKGDTELAVLAKAGKAVLPDKFPNSGTPARLMNQLAGMNMPAAIATLFSAPPKLIAQRFLNKQKSIEEPPANRLSALGN